VITRESNCWHKDFLEEQDAVEDEPHSGRPVKEATHKTKVVAYDRRLIDH
jgi:hypothetical protein